MWGYMSMSTVPPLKKPYQLVEIQCVDKIAHMINLDQKAIRENSMPLDYH